MININEKLNISDNYGKTNKLSQITTAQVNEDIPISFDNNIDEQNSCANFFFGFGKKDEEYDEEDSISFTKKQEYTIKELEEALNERLLPESKSSILSRHLLSLKNKEDELYSPEEILVFSLLDDSEWNRLINRNLLDNGLSIKNLLSYTNLDDKEWEIVKKRNLLEINKMYPDFNFSDLSNLLKINDKDWENIDIVNKFCNKARNPLPFNTFSMLTRLTPEEWTENKDIISRIDSNGNVGKTPFYFYYEKIKGYSPQISTLKSYNKQNEKVTISSLEQITDRTDYDIANENLYGKMHPLAEKALSRFKELYPDIDLRIDNDTPYEKVIDILDSVKEYIDNHYMADVPFSKTMIFTKMNKASGVSNVITANKNLHKIYPGICADKKSSTLEHLPYLLEIYPRVCVNIDSNKNVQDIVLAHENAHFRDKPRPKNAKVPEHIINILQKGLDNYAFTNEAELIAILTEAIETPNNKDYNPWTSIMHVRQDIRGNYFLMMPKEYKGINAKKLNEVGKYLRSIDFPPIMPDYEEQKHGKTYYYNETLIRKAK